MLKRLTIALVLLTGSACDHSVSGPSSAPILPTQTTPSRPPEPTTVGERWNVTTTFRTFTEAEACEVYKTYIGQSTYWSMAVERSGESIHLVLSDPDNPNDRIDYNGTVVSDVLTAASKNFTEGRVCGGSRVAVAAERYVSGRFSREGHALTAQEIISTQLSSGEILVFHFDWSAAPE
jgi:hypothetical protein